MTFLENNPELVFLCVYILFFAALQWFDSKTQKDILSQNLTDCLSDSSMMDDTITQKSDDQKTIAELKERVAVLEKVITDSRYELDQKLKNL